ncbi:MAG: hypothetical protein M1136_02480 [Chloroflexi bacterium]|nr:hypothetical protein [Chloroflexota bacterium]
MGGVEGTENIVVRPVYLRAVNAIVQPERQAPCTEYFLHQWLSRLGALRWGLVLTLRTICTQRQTDGTNRGEVSRGQLSEMLGVHEATITRLLATVPSPTFPGWREIDPAQSDDAEKTIYLAKFIPRLRYKYVRDATAGVTRRIGYIIDVVMDDPLTPEDEERLAVALAAQILHGGHCPLDEVKEQNDLSASVIPQSSPSLPLSQGESFPHNTQNLLSHSEVIAHDAISRPDVRKHNASSQASLNAHNAPPEPLKGQGGPVLTLTYNYMGITINRNLKRRTEIRRAVKPLAEYAARRLHDEHSLAMFYSTLLQLYPDHLELFGQSLDEAIVAGEGNAALNMGAFFVRSLKRLAADLGVPLRLGAPSGTERTALGEEEESEREAEGGVGGVLIPNVALPGTRLSGQQVWRSALEELRAQTGRAAYEMWLRNCHIVGTDGQVVIIGVPNQFALDWLSERLAGSIETALSRVIGQRVKVRCEVYG